MMSSACSTVLSAVVLASLLTPASSLKTDGPALDALLLAGLRAAREKWVNPAIKRETPDPWRVDYEASNRSSMCIIPGPHTCLCHGTVGYNVTLDSLRGMSDMAIQSFDSLHAVVQLKNLSKYDLTIAGSLDDQSLGANGTARASIGACGITPSLHGDASADGNVTATVTMRAEGVIHRSGADGKRCMQIRIKSMAIPALEADLSNIHVALDFGVFHLPISYFVDLFKGPLTRELKSELTTDLPKELPAKINPVLPCIPVL